MASDPQPGEIYAIQKGDSLLAATSRAYGVKAGAERLRLAQKINAHPLNRRFWRAPTTTFEKSSFPDGIISFNPEFTRGDPQRRAAKGEEKVFARLFIPPREDLVHMRLGPAVPLPPEAAPQRQPDPNPCDHLDSGCLAPRGPGHVSIGDTDKRVLVGNPVADIPNRWICSIVAIVEDSHGGSWMVGGGTGVRIGPNHVLTAAHVLQYPARTGATLTVSRTVAVALVFGRHGVITPPAPVPAPAAAASSYGGILVTGAENFWVAPEWSAAMARGETPDDGTSDLYAFDYGLIRFDSANRCRAVATLGAAPRHWGVANSSASVSDTAAFWSRLMPGQELRTAGYPGDKPCTQWASGGPLRDLFSVGKGRFQDAPKNAWMSFDADFAGGMSGSPVWRRVAGRRTDPRLDPPDRLVLAGIAGSSATQGTTYAASLTPFAWNRLRTQMAK